MAKDQAPSRHACHCGKTFIRKEHLRRHQATHGERSFICFICQRSFTRNDLLRRHLSRHDTAAAPDPRRGRACDACHANKTKCDGGLQCSLCAKRVIPCTYKLVAAKASLPEEAMATERESSVVDSAATDHSSTPEADLTPPTEAPNESPREPVSVTESVLGSVPESEEQGIAARALGRFATVLSARTTSLEDDFRFSDEDKIWAVPSADKYFERFHECWPILHAPTFYSMSPPITGSLTAAMIGAWLINPEEVDRSALQLHGVLMDRFIEHITHTQHHANMDKAWPIELYQAMVMNLVFAFYQGTENVVTKAILLRSLLIAALREEGFFIGEKAADQQTCHQPGTFIPWIHLMRERWKRLVTSLYKIDIYMAIARGQPPVLHREELDVPLPASFALWNGYGLNVFFQRLPQELPGRQAYRLSGIMNDPHQLATPLLLVEDIQMGLSGMMQTIWDHAEARRQTAVGARAFNQGAVDATVWQLETWKTELERLSQQCTQSFLTEQTNDYAFAAYLGKYDEDPAREKISAMMHIKCDVSDALLLYHILGMQIYADFRTMNSVARYSQAQFRPGFSTPPRFQKYQAQLIEWAGTPQCRRAFLHAVAVLRARESSMEGNEAQMTAFDVMGFMATSISALVVWSTMTYNSTACSCVPGPNHIDIGIDPPNLQATSRLETWIQEGGTAALQGIPFCRCVSDGWMARFSATIPQGNRGWELSGEMAPILRSSGRANA